MSGAPYTKTDEKSEITLLVNSAYGANKSADGHSFVQRLSPPIRVPTGKDPMIEASEVAIWHTSPNVKTGINDVLRFTFSAVSSGAVQTFTFPSGLYSLNSINLRLQHFLISLGLDQNTVSFVPVQAESKLLIHFQPDTASGTVGIDFSNAANTMREFLGFQGSGSLSAAAESSVYGSNVSKFNSLEYYKLEAVGLSISGGYGESGGNDSNCIAVVIPNVSPSQLIVQRLAHPIKLHCNIAGATISQITWRLLDNNDQPVNTNSENFSARVRITY